MLRICPHCKAQDFNLRNLDCLVCGKPFSPSVVPPAPAVSHAATTEAAGADDHCPTPWYRSQIFDDGRWGIITGDNLIILGACRITTADVTFICGAVNSFDEMKKALRKFLDAGNEVCRSSDAMSILLFGEAREAAIQALSNAERAQ